MSLLVVGSVALDSVETPTQTRDRVLGGSATYFSYAASFFTPVRLVGVVGEDCPRAYRRCQAARSTPRGCKWSRAARRFAGGASTCPT